MVLFLRLEVSQHHIKLARAYRKRAVAALPEKAAIPRVELFDPFRRYFLNLLDELSLGSRSRQRCDDVNVIRYASMRTSSAPRSRQIVAK
jgi:hypothetical protein